MSEEPNEEELAQIRQHLLELKLEHSDLDDAIEHLSQSGTFEELKLKRLKKRKLQLKDQIARLEDKLIPDMLA
jgi:hypothetical protein